MSQQLGIGTLEFELVIQITVPFSLGTLKHVRLRFGLQLLTFRLCWQLNEIAGVLQRFLQLVHGIGLGSVFGQMFKPKQGLHRHGPLALQNITVQTELKGALAV